MAEFPRKYQTNQMRKVHVYCNFLQFQDDLEF